MKNVFLLFLAFFTSNILFADSLPIGQWKTIDDVTGKEKAIIEISLNAKKELEGRIVKVFYEAGKENETTCKVCPGDKKDQPLVGLVILEKLTQDKGNKNDWRGGTILDPKTGKVYRCQLSLDEKNQTLKVRGYLGIALLGRTQFWQKIISKS